MLVLFEDFPMDRYFRAMWPIVPRTWVVMLVFRTSTNYAKPKSRTTTSKSSSSITLVAFTSRWIILGLQCSWRYSKPCAVPKATCFLVGQSITGSLSLSYVFTITSKDAKFYICTRKYGNPTYPNTLNKI